MTEISCQYAEELCTRKVPIFASLSEEDLAKVSVMIKHRKYEKGEALILEEQPSDTLFIIKQGHVKLLKTTPQPDISLKLLKTVTKRLAHAENLAQSLATKDPEIRIVHMILELVDKYGKTVQGQIKVELPLSREELANYVGVTRETISRKFSKFERLGMIEIKGTREITIRNMQKLNEYID
ncbi:cAMP-binding protein [Paenibacillus larvae subsp. pulvifaciens]|uniref:cAMP-binding protein n=1 Tax=Paenibacillus larvae subsp. pulvifaciens TaxID=1477 RepID=A0A1V0UUD9_9BACL|nr:Crp/Fnr family transcriptional regulator [Paenibacillus larvae]ARF68855.1 cAMP-binding protein [Paenibacillus larvae subsp. pulvifaciens]